MRVAADNPGDTPAPVDFVQLVELARNGDLAAKEALVDHLKGLVWHTIADFGLSREDRQDVFAGAFCRLFESLGTIREPGRLPGWIATTARNEAHTLLRARGRTVVSDEMEEGDDTMPPTDEEFLDRELRTALWAGFQVLPHSCRELLRLLTADPRISYEEIGGLLDMPHGSIGPTRQRCLERLRNTPQLRPFLEGGRP